MRSAGLPFLVELEALMLDGLHLQGGRHARAWPPMATALMLQPHAQSVTTHLCSSWSMRRPFLAFLVKLTLLNPQVVLGGWASDGSLPPDDAQLHPTAALIHSDILLQMLGNALPWAAIPGGAGGPPAGGPGFAERLGSSGPCAPGQIVSRRLLRCNPSTHHAAATRQRAGHAWLPTAGRLHLTGQPL
jgi:hypothetical protein